MTTATALVEPFDAHTLYKTIQSTPHGGSEFGLSKYRVATHCGYKAYLDAQKPQMVAVVDDHPAQDGEKLNALKVGILYHTLHELRLRGQMPDEVWDLSDPAWSGEFIEALRLYRGYIRHFGSLQERFGAELISTELDLPADETLQAAVIEKFGAPLTGRADSVIRVVNPQQALQNCKLMLEPGVYIHDFKTSATRNSIHEFEFTSGLQGSAYLYLYNLMHPEEPAKGIIFDVIYKHKELRIAPVFDAKGKMKSNSSFEAFLQWSCVDDEAKLLNLVALARRNLNDQTKNPAHCFSSTRPCEYYLNGECGGF